MLRKIFVALLAIIFGLFAYWQLNDKDPQLWVPIYGGVAILIGLNLFINVPRIIGILASVGLGIGMAFYIPGVIEWFQEGMPSITGSMKAGSPYIENMREFLGLFLALAALLAVYLTKK
ncbi:MAG: transmembrane 220 family protein [Bacteroidia bacterium]|nr:transmembrane 220 family protein [Bacteroidia bacterium]